ncbi:GNAT family N-acetyltransferase [Devosia sp. A16]|uniref:GNAT family N-acetyltransferase n=1 Tax=Devosia sp. A16 TaxID=1736675 RepID=UPI001AEC20C4|nr:GNAT family N-acetyltransferase [Devosia sp. A16]
MERSTQGHRTQACGATRAVPRRRAGRRSHRHRDGRHDGHRGSVYYLATGEAHAGNGYGAALLAELERRLTAMGCPKINLLVRGENDGVLKFYDRLGYERHDSLSLGRRLIED